MLIARRSDNLLANDKQMLFHIGEGHKSILFFTISYGHILDAVAVASPDMQVALS
jgi:hypothetical protein